MMLKCQQQLWMAILLASSLLNLWRDGFFEDADQLDGRDSIQKNSTAAAELASLNDLAY